jgi:hypothetical protein
MFKSKSRSVNIPQYEHSRLAGLFALAWGNNAFDRPAIDFAAFVQGVALHDWHYGVIDNLPIGEAGEAEWLAMVRRGVAYWLDDPVSDIVAKLHLKRLLSNRESAAVAALVSQIDLRVTERLPQTGLSRSQFEWADKITRFCDDLAFAFSFEQPVTATHTLYADVNSRTETAVSFALKAGGEITVEPWPFGAPSLSGIITGFERSGYPDRLEPVVIPYSCMPAR